jgi:hypothetical protein
MVMTKADLRALSRYSEKDLSYFIDFTRNSIASRAKNGYTTYQQYISKSYGDVFFDRYIDSILDNFPDINFDCDKTLDPDCRVYTFSWAY